MFSQKIIHHFDPTHAGNQALFNLLCDATHDQVFTAWYQQDDAFQVIVDGLIGRTGGLPQGALAGSVAILRGNLARIGFNNLSTAARSFLDVLVHRLKSSSGWTVAKAVTPPGTPERPGQGGDGGGGAGGSIVAP